MALRCQKKVIAYAWKNNFIPRSFPWPFCVNLSNRRIISGFYYPSCEFFSNSLRKFHNTNKIGFEVDHYECDRKCSAPQDKEWSNGNYAESLDPINPNFIKSWLKSTEIAKESTENYYEDSNDDINTYYEIDDPDINPYSDTTNILSNRGKNQLKVNRDSFLSRLYLAEAQAVYLHERNFESERTIKGSRNRLIPDILNPFLHGRRRPNINNMPKWKKKQILEGSRDSDKAIIKVLDIDSVPSDFLVKLFVFKCVKEFPAEKCIKIASRIGKYIDKPSNISYINLTNDLCQIFGDFAAEMIAYFSRINYLISIPYMLNYIRMFGTFSRSFIMKEIERSSNPMTFDFVRYSKYSGIRPVPEIIIRPWSLSSFTKLLDECSMKKAMYLHLKLNKHIHRIEDACLKQSELNNQFFIDSKISNSLTHYPNFLVNSKSEDTNPNHHSVDLNREEKKSQYEAYRNHLYDYILASEHLNMSLLEYLENVQWSIQQKNKEKSLNTLALESSIIKEDTSTGIHVIGEEKFINLPSRHTVGAVSDVQNIPIVSESDLLSLRSFKNLKTDALLDPSDVHPRIYKSPKFHRLESYNDKPLNEPYWKLPWGCRRDKFKFKGAFYAIKDDKGWVKVGEDPNKPRRRRIPHRTKRERNLKKKILLQKIKNSLLSK